MQYVSRHLAVKHGMVVFSWVAVPSSPGLQSRLPITTLVRTVQRLSVCVRCCLPLHNFNVGLLSFVGEVSI
ncbi:hypothetical protein H6G89_18405 [Oscillatoria sp. FACHB-1407]|uniref:hypothetical protein n=1 Tax=Oscillatoria sp. FACHB-1407 TaxID=2692847 RepID=UPI001686E9E6|nr:hypothetical protein [Oscillatoria sp. FACHB-1407]MBD2463016.1 hypothetical protein [Oscillatoria sp. FACHB-1407]